MASEGQALQLQQWCFQGSPRGWAAKLWWLTVTGLLPHCLCTSCESSLSHGSTGPAACTRLHELLSECSLVTSICNTQAHENACRTPLVTYIMQCRGLMMMMMP